MAIRSLWTMALGGSLYACSNSTPEPTNASPVTTPRHPPAGTTPGHSQTSTPQRPTALALALAVPARAEAVDCSAWPSALAVPGGPFLMGSQSGGRDESPLHVVHVSGFCMDRLERTAGEVAAWMERTDREPSRDDSRTLTPGNVQENLAATELTWVEARDFCADQGGRLPTEAEWEKAARGGCELGDASNRCDPADVLTYPWGEQTPSCTLANHMPLGPTGPRPCTGASQNPGSLSAGASPYGFEDMAGNAWEWVADWYHPQLYQGVRTDPGGPATGIAHVLRGGSWNTLPTNMRVANRMSGLVQGSATGVRCAYGGASDTTTDTPPALNWQTIDGQVARRDGGALEGRALYVSAFAEQDLDNGQPRMGASPVSEISLDPSGASLSFELSVPEGRYMLMAALDDRPPTPPSAAWTPPSASGGVGQQYPVSSGESSLKLFLDAVPTQGHRGPGTP